MNNVSLLYPGKYEITKHAIIEEENLNDLEANSILYELKMQSTSLFNLVTADPEVISYRLDIIEDLIENETFFNMLVDVYPMVDEINSINIDKKDSGSEEPVYYLKCYQELLLFIECINKIYEFVSTHKPSIKSRGMNQFINNLDQFAESDDYKKLTADIGKYKSFDYPRSITVAFNLDEQLKPYEAGVVSINSDYYKSGNFIDKLLRLDISTQNTCIAPLTTAISDRNADKIIINNSILGALNKIYKKGIHDIAGTVKRYIRTGSKILFDVKELAFYINCVNFIKKVRKLGLPMCKPEVAEKRKRIFHVKNIYNINLGLAKRGEVVKNNISFDDDGRLYVLTGPNQGGKTVFAQAVGITQILFQIGMFVQGLEATISPANRLFTHFLQGEDHRANAGLLGIECRKFKTIIDNASEYSMAIMNEPFSSTSFGEGTYLSKEILMTLGTIGVRGIFVKHFHELCNMVDEMYSSNLKSKVGNLVVGIASTVDKQGFRRRTFKITKGKSDGISYAKDIARKYGIEFKKQ